MQTEPVVPDLDPAEVDALLDAADTFYPLLAATTERYAEDRAALRRVVTDLAWQARARGRAVPPVPDELTGHAQRVARYYAGQRLRFDFRFRELQRVIEPWLGSGDALLTALAGFAALGRGEPMGRALVERSLAAADADDKSRHVCLHALWFSRDREDLTLLLALSEEMLAAGAGGANAHYRRAGALRRLGRYDEAMVEIELAIERHGSGDTAVHQDYVRERELILAVAATAGVADATVARLAGLETRLDERLGKAEDLVNDSLLRTIEILGLFLALTGFVVGTSTAAVKSSDWWQLVVAMGLLVAGSAAFLLMMRWVVSSQRER
ncbi:hypothetical protein [Nocardioides sp. HB32]